MKSFHLLLLIIVVLSNCSMSYSNGLANDSDPTPLKGNGQQAGFKITNFETYATALTRREGARYNNKHILLEPIHVIGKSEPSFYWSEYAFSLDKGFESIFSITADIGCSNGFSLMFLENDPQGVSSNYPVKNSGGASISLTQTTPNSIKVNCGSIILPLVKGSIIDGKNHKVKLLYVVDTKSQYRTATLSIYIDDMKKPAGILPITRMGILWADRQYHPGMATSYADKPCKLYIDSWSFRSLNTDLPSIQDSDIDRFAGFMNITRGNTTYNIKLRNYTYYPLDHLTKARSFSLSPEANVNYENDKTTFDLNISLSTTTDDFSKGSSLLTRGRRNSDVGDYSVLYYLDKETQGVDAIETLYSRQFTGTTLMKDAVRYDGTVGKEITFTDIITDDNTDYKFSGKFYIWGVPPENFTPIKNKLINFCGKYDLQDVYEEGEPNYHRYEVTRVICNKKNNPYCTVENVFKHMISDINYVAPASPEAFIYPSNIIFKNNKPYEVLTADNPPLDLAKTKEELLTIGRIKEIVNTEIVLARRNQGNKVIDCKVSYLFGAGDLTNGTKSMLEQIFSALNPFGGPSGIIYGENQNPIVNSVYLDKHQIVNRTLLNHFFSPGKVTRTVKEVNGEVVIHTEGVGITKKSITNEYAGTAIFERIDNNFWLDFNIIATSPELQQKVKN